MSIDPEPSQVPSSRRVVASYGRYREAERAVDHLSDRGFPVEQTAIAAQGLRFVEQVTGRRTVARAAAEGAGQGAVVGGLTGVLLGLFATATAGLVLLVYGMVLGLILGAVSGFAFHTASGGRRDFSSTGRMEADHYEVLVDEPVADEALRLLGEAPPPDSSR